MSQSAYRVHADSGHAGPARGAWSLGAPAAQQPSSASQMASSVVFLDTDMPYQQFQRDSGVSRPQAPSRRPPPRIGLADRVQPVQHAQFVPLWPAAPFPNDPPPSSRAGSTAAVAADPLPLASLLAVDAMDLIPGGADAVGSGPVAPANTQETAHTRQVAGNGRLELQEQIQLRLLALQEQKAQLDISVRKQEEEINLSQEQARAQAHARNLVQGFLQQQQQERVQHGQASTHNLPPLPQLQQTRQIQRLQLQQQQQVQQLQKLQQEQLRALQRRQQQQQQRQQQEQQRQRHAYQHHSQSTFSVTGPATSTSSYMQPSPAPLVDMDTDMGMDMGMGMGMGVDTGAFPAQPSSLQSWAQAHQQVGQGKRQQGQLGTSMPLKPPSVSGSTSRSKRKFVSPAHPSREVDLGVGPASSSAGGAGSGWSDQVFTFGGGAPSHNGISSTNSASMVDTHVADSKQMQQGSGLSLDEHRTPNGSTFLIPAQPAWATKADAKTTSMAASVGTRTMETDVVMATTPSAAHSSSSTGSRFGTLSVVSSATSAAVRRTPKSNSTSTIFSRFTISNPDLNELLLSVVTVLRLQMQEDAEGDPSRISEFQEWDETLFEVPSETKTKIPAKTMEFAKRIVSHAAPRRSKRRKHQIPELVSMCKFVSGLFTAALFSDECAIISLILVNRLLAFTSMPLHAANWRPVYVTALLVSQKVWDDRSLKNAAFAALCPMFSKKKVNELERLFLSLTGYDVSISARLYAKYYFQLRELAEKASASFSLPPLSSREAKQLEARSRERTRAQHKRLAALRRRSHNDTDPSTPGTASPFVIS